MGKFTACARRIAAPRCSLGGRHRCLASRPRTDRAQTEGQSKVSEVPKENEVRRLLSKALSRRRRQAGSSSVYEARHLNLNQEFEERRGEGFKIFFFILALFALLIFAVSQMVGLERSLG
jgi:hypothetical protein